jgi:hypothetical protein
MVATAEYITSKENVTNVFFSEITELLEPRLYRGDHSVLKSMSMPERGKPSCLI